MKVIFVVVKQLKQLHRPEKNLSLLQRDLNPRVLHDTDAMFYQLSYEALLVARRLHRLAIHIAGYKLRPRSLPLMATVVEVACYAIFRCNLLSN